MLFDCNNGDCVLVDFACLFEKGKLLKVPEVVPFRLTHNMVDAFGVQKCEGVFRKCCEVAMNVLRTNKDTLMNVLETFIHDPLVEWNEKQMDKNAPLQVIEKKLLGIMESGLPLSVQGQVHSLIQSATSLENLTRMYPWWSKFFYYF